MDRGAWQSAVHRVAELETTEATLRAHTHTLVLLNAQEMLNSVSRAAVSKAVMKMFPFSLALLSSPQHLHNVSQFKCSSYKLKPRWLTSFLYILWPSAPPMNEHFCTVPLNVPSTHPTSLNSKNTGVFVNCFMPNTTWLKTACIRTL